MRSRIMIVLVVLVVVASLAGASMIWYSFRIDSIFSTTVNKDLASFKAAQNLEIYLINQKGYVSYYFIDGNPKWLIEVRKYRKSFEEQLDITWQLAENENERGILSKIERQYARYTRDKDKVIEYYKLGDKGAGLELHRLVRAQFFDLMNLCDQYKNLYDENIKKSLLESKEELGQVKFIAASMIVTSMVLGVTLAFVLFVQILNPIRRLTRQAARAEGISYYADDVTALGFQLQDLIKDVDQTKGELERSREQLLKSEKMAVLGKLAAEVAHSIRNPMTSIKMRLFSLQRNLNLNDNQKEDLGVVAEEMRRLDNIVQNFLEFSRPPKLEKQKINLSEMVDMSLQLLEKRLEHTNIRVDRRRSKWIPPIEGDPELLKEVIVNLIVNACDAMPHGGRLLVTEENAVAEKIGRAILLKISDDGPGVPEPLREKIMEPFFSTKEDGTGLGLSMVKQTIESHGGMLEVRKGDIGGATFVITLPVQEEQL